MASKSSKVDQELNGTKVVDLKEKPSPMSFETKEAYVKKLKEHMELAKEEVMAMLEAAYPPITTAIFDEHECEFFAEFVAYKKDALEDGSCNGSIVDVLMKNVLTKKELDEKIEYFGGNAKSRAGLTKKNKIEIKERAERRLKKLKFTKTKYMQLYKLCQKMKEAKKAKQKVEKGDKEDAEKLVLDLLALDALYEPLNLSDTNKKNWVKLAGALKTLPKHNKHASEALYCLLDQASAGENLVFSEQVKTMKKLDDDAYIHDFLVLYQQMIHIELQSELKVNISHKVRNLALLNMFVWAREHYVVGLGEKGAKKIKCKIDPFPFVKRLNYCFPQKKEEVDWMKEHM